MAFTHTTQVRINLNTLRDQIIQLEANYKVVGNRETTQGRSRFSTWNNIKKFQERISCIDPKDFIRPISRTKVADCDSCIIEVMGEAKGDTARVYYKPSITSLAKPFRHCVVPKLDENVFLFFDLKAAEFYLFCVFAQEKEACESYHRGEDIYMNYAHLFPEGTDRKIIKKVMIANMYDTTAYRVALDVGITETQADRLLANIARSVPNMTKKKVFIVMQARRKQAYFAPQGFDQTNLIKVSDVDPKVGFNYRLALSSYIQSSLGLWMQSIIEKVEKKTRGTVLSVFDSVLVEVPRTSVDNAKVVLAKMIAPFRTGAMNVGTTFYNAQEGIVED